MIGYEKDLFGNDWKITVDSFSFQATKTKIELKIGKTLIKSRVFDITTTQAKTLNSFISMNEEELYEKGKKIISTYRLFYYIFTSISFAKTFFQKQKLN